MLSRICIDLYIYMLHIQITVEDNWIFFSSPDQVVSMRLCDVKLEKFVFLVLCYFKVVFSARNLKQGQKMYLALLF